MSINNNKARKPEDQTSIGYVLWLILGGKNANIKESAGYLGVGPANLSSIIHGKRLIPKQVLQANSWADILKQHYPQAWSEHGATFDKHVQALISQQQGKSIEPANKNSFGYILWQILGGKNSNIAISAQHLGIQPSHLGNIIHGTRNVTQEYLTEKEWRAIFQKYYSDAWEKHKNIFEKYALDLSPIHGSSKNYGPEINEGPRYLLWKILGGPNIHIEGSAKRLGTSPLFLSHVIKGYWQIPVASINKWRDALQQDCQNTWRKYGNAFQEHLDHLAAKEQTYIPKPKDKKKFGVLRALWTLLVSTEINLDEFAKHLREKDIETGPRTLQLTLLGWRRVLPKDMDQYREVFREYYKPEWFRHCETFEAAYEVFKNTLDKREDYKTNKSQTADMEWKQNAGKLITHFIECGQETLLTKEIPQFKDPDILDQAKNGNEHILTVVYKEAASVILTACEAPGRPYQLYSEAKLLLEKAA